MELKFESVRELREFLDFAYETGRLVAVGREAPAQTIVLKSPTLEDFDRALAGTVLNPDWVTNALPPDDVQQGGVTNGSEPEQISEAPKRKRRTKAEIAADEAAAAVVNEAVEPTSDASADNGNPFEQVGSENVQAILNAPDQKSAIAAGIAATSSGTTDELPARDDAAAMDAITHLNRCREFIASQGMPKYNESFTVAGLQPNVMAYSDADRAHHATALDHLTPKA